MTSLSAGRGTSVLGGADESPSSGYKRDVASAIGSLQLGHTMQLNETEVVLDSTLFVAASDVTIRGIDGKTTVRCPAAGDAFVIK